MTYYLAYYYNYVAVPSLAFRSYEFHMSILLASQIGLSEQNKVTLKFTKSCVFMKIYKNTIKHFFYLFL